VEEGGNGSLVEIVDDSVQDTEPTILKVDGEE
jgi:hypothetical protein